MPWPRHATIKRTNLYSSINFTFLIFNFCRHTEVHVPGYYQRLNVLICLQTFLILFFNGACCLQLDRWSPWKMLSHPNITSLLESVDILPKHTLQVTVQVPASNKLNTKCHLLAEVHSDVNVALYSTTGFCGWHTSALESSMQTLIDLRSLKKESIKLV